MVPSPRWDIGSWGDLYKGRILLGRKGGNWANQLVDLKLAGQQDHEDTWQWTHEILTVAPTYMGEPVRGLAVLHQHLRTLSHWNSGANVLVTLIVPMRAGDLWINSTKRQVTLFICHKCIKRVRALKLSSQGPTAIKGAWIQSHITWIPKPIHWKDLVSKETPN